MRPSGSPGVMGVQNKDFANWEGGMEVGPAGPEVDRKENTRVVPGHADFPGALKYMAHDMRNVLERASARETAARVAAGAVARAFLDELGIKIPSRVVSVGPITASDMPTAEIDWEMVEECDVRTCRLYTDDAADAPTLGERGR